MPALLSSAPRRFAESTAEVRTGRRIKNRVANSPLTHSLTLSQREDFTMPIYIQYGTLTGDVTAAGHEKWIEVNSFQWGVGRGISSPTGGSSDRESSAPSSNNSDMPSTPFIGVRIS